MAKPTTLPYSHLFVIALVSFFLFSKCNHHQHSDCSSALPEIAFTDTLKLFLPDAANSGNDGMQLIPGGEFTMGAVEGDSFAREEEFPAHQVQVDSFWVDATEVTNAQFRAFVKATGYKTTAERAMPAGSLVFVPDSKADKELYWWEFTEQTDWQHPFGPDSNIDTMDNYPVVHVSWFDAMAYASWVGKRLPTEAEWEYAARSGKTGGLYPWGDTGPEDVSVANVYQGRFPDKNEIKDGFAYTAPVQSFAPNAYGVYDMSGNVWEWCADKFHSSYYAYCKENNLTANLQGPTRSYTPENRYEELRVIRGGSFLCNKSYCTGYRVSARNKTTPATSLLNVGFRCVRGVGE